MGTKRSPVRCWMTLKPSNKRANRTLSIVQYQCLIECHNTYYTLEYSSFPEGEELGDKMGNYKEYSFSKLQFSYAMFIHTNKIPNFDCWNKETKKLEFIRFAFNILYCRLLRTQQEAVSSFSFSLRLSTASRTCSRRLHSAGMARCEAGCQRREKELRITTNYSSIVNYWRQSLHRYFVKMVDRLGE